VIGSLRSRFRGLLSGRKERSLPRRGAKPSIGAYIVNGGVRMTIQAGMSDQLWRWLMDQGWREPGYRPDRRCYKEIPASWVTLLIDAQADQREEVLGIAIAKATHRPGLRRPQGMPAYLKRR